MMINLKQLAQEMLDTIDDQNYGDLRVVNEMSSIGAMYKRGRLDEWRRQVYRNALTAISNGQPLPAEFTTAFRGGA